VVGSVVLAALLLVVAGTVGVRAQARVDRASPEIGGGPWINSPPLGAADLRGRVVFVEFWTYG
jgi:hypothetical protein